VGEQPAVARIVGSHTDGMGDLDGQQSWTSQLESAVACLAEAPEIPTVYQTLALAWRATASVGHPMSAATELRWMRLAEALFSAWNDLSTLDDPPGPIGHTASPSVDGALEDTPQHRAAVAGLLRTAAAALRHLSVTAERDDVDAALTMSSIAAGLDSAVEDWP
jgi:hypothetical protein